MENASKALTMAGSVLFAIMIISALVFGYNKLNETSEEREEAKLIEQMTEFNQEFETYNRKDVYGAELLSLINKIEDYNTSIIEADEGYQEITGNIQFVLEWNGIQGNITINNLINKIDDIDSRLATIENNAGGNTKMKQIVDWYKQYNSLRMKNYISESEKYLNKINSSSVRNIETIKRYISYQDLMTDIKRRYFKCVLVEYEEKNKTGRITRMDFKEIDTSKIN